MQCIRGIGLGFALVVAFTGLASAQPATNDLTLIKIDTGAVRGTAASGVVSFKGIPLLPLR